MSTTSEKKWSKASCWVASFDILGFSNLINIDSDSIEAEFVQEDYAETIKHLEKHCDVYASGCIDYLWFADTFVMFTPDDSARSYTVIQQAAKHFIESCLYSSIPIRGAISVGAFVRSHDNRALIGRAFVDAHVFGEDQNWLGLLLTPTAIQKARSYGLEPQHHDFVSSAAIPMRKCHSSVVLAYRFQNGSANYESPLLPLIENMRQKAGALYFEKYYRTAEFIRSHYRYIKA